jgi:hypothetical protein
MLMAQDSVNQLILGVYYSATILSKYRAQFEHLTDAPTLPKYKLFYPWQV